MIDCDFTNSISLNDIEETLDKELNNDMNIVFFAGHTMGYYDNLLDSFVATVPPYNTYREKDIASLLRIFETPLETLELSLKYMQKYTNSYIYILLNDISNIYGKKSNKSICRKQLIDNFSDIDGLPLEYIKLFKQYNISLDRVIRSKEKLFWQESQLLNNFSKLISITSNKNLIDSFHIRSKCSIVTLEMTLEIFHNYNKELLYRNDDIINPIMKDNLKENLFILFHPASCNIHILEGLDYYKQFLSNKNFNYIMFPYGETLLN